jgi:hypothetical protein
MSRILRSYLYAKLQISDFHQKWTDKTSNREKEISIRIVTIVKSFQYINDSI